MFIKHSYIKYLFFLSNVIDVYCGAGKKKKNYNNKQSGSILKSKRFFNYGNFGIVKYNSEKPITKTKQNIKFQYECKDLYDIIINNPILQMALKGYLLIAGTPSFSVGTAENNIFEGKKVSISNFLLKSTKVTRDEYYSFLEALLNFLSMKGKNFYMDEKRIKEKFLIDKKKRITTKNKKKLEKQIEERRESDEFEKILDDYFVLRRDMLNNLSEEYLHNMIPRFSDFKDFPNKDNRFFEKYCFENEYGSYPIVCVSYLQYVEFCKWQTFCINEFLFENLKPDERYLVIVYPVSYAEFIYACCCGNSKWLYSCGNFNVIDEDGNYKFNFNKGQNDNNSINITSVYKYPKNKYGLYDATGNTSVWFRNNETEYIYNYDNGNKNKDVDWRIGVFNKLLQEGAQLNNTDYNSLDIENRVKMVSRGTCNSTLSDVQNGKYDNCHIFETNPFLGFITAAKVITVSKKKNIY